MAFEKIKSVKELKLAASEIRCDIIRMLVESKSGHTAGSLGMTDIFAALYLGVANHDPKNPDWDGRDKILLSNGHICPILYATLAYCDYFPRSELMTLRKLGSHLQGHPHWGHLPGIENTSGPLGQGLSQACGLALADKLDSREGLIFCLTSDGEHQEGQTWEAVMFASKYKLGKIIQIMDRNNIQIDGNTEDIMPLESLKKKYEAFNWEVHEVDGNDMSAVLSLLEKLSAKARSSGGNSAPIIIIANTLASKGFYSAEGSYKWHGKTPSKEEGEIALADILAASEKIRAE